MKNNILLFLFIFVVFLTLPASAQQQEELLVVPGSRVRVYVPMITKPYVGNVVALEADTLVLKAEGKNSPLVFRLTNLKKLEVSRRHGKSWVPFAGAAMGLVAGTGIGAVIGFHTATDNEPVDETFSGGLIGGVGGIVLGAVIGTAIGAERWEEVPLEKVRMSILLNSERIHILMSSAY